MTADEIRERLESAHLVVEPFTHHESGMSFLGFTAHGVWPQWAALLAFAPVAQAPAEVEQCHTCGGGGMVMVARACPNCGGHGCGRCSDGAVPDQDQCPDCGGTGEVQVGPAPAPTENRWTKLLTHVHEDLQSACAILRWARGKGVSVDGLEDRLEALVAVLGGRPNP